MTIKLVTFDLDNTLWDVDTIIRRAEAEMRAWIDPHVGAFKAIDPNHMGTLRRTVVEADPTLRHDVSRLRLALLQQAFIECGVIPDEAANIAHDAFAVFMDWRNRVDFFEGALEMLTALSQDYRLAALTNGNANIDRVGLGEFFSFAISAADVGASKPAPDMFLAALERSNVGATEAVHIGDNPIDDIEGASNAGLHSIWVNHADSDDDVVATRTVTDLAALVNSVASIG